MDVVVLMGAGNEPAQSIARRLVGLGSRVYGLAHKFPDQGFAHREFIPVGVNPADPVAVREAVERIAAKEGAITTVILAGHTPVEDAFEAAHPHDVALAVFAGLAAPLAAVRAAIPGLVRRRGLVLALTRPVFGPGAALGGVVEAGLSAFCEGLFAELRDTGVRICHLRLQENPNGGDPAARFTNAPQSRIQPDIVADTVESVMRLRENNAISRLVIRPQATREEPRLPVTAEPRLASLQLVQLPTSQNYPAPEEKILTPLYRRPDYAPPPEDKETEDDDDDEGVDPELAYLIKPRHRDRILRENAPTGRAPAPHAAPEAEGGEWVDAEPAAPEPAAPESGTPEGESPLPRVERRPEPAFRGHAPQPGRDRHPQQERRDNRPPKNGALRIQPPVTHDPAAPSRDLHPGYRKQQDELRARRENGEQPPRPHGDNRPPRPIEQMPRPHGWQGPRMPQVLPDRQSPRPQHDRDPRDRRPFGDDRRDNRPGRPDAAPEAASAETPASAPAAEATPPAPVEIASATSPAPVEVVPAAPRAPVAIPVVTPHEVSRDPAPAAAPRSGRSEAVTLTFAPKPPAAPAAPVEVVPESAPESADEPEAKPKRKPAAAKKPAKAKAEKTEVAPEGDAGEAPAAPKPKRGRPPKKAE